MIRIQRRRVKGFKTPPHSFYVGRPTEFQNPFAVGKPIRIEWFDRFDIPDKAIYFSRYKPVNDNAEAVRLFEKYRLDNISTYALQRIANFDSLNCYCKPELPCHADSLIKRIQELKLSGELK